MARYHDIADALRTRITNAEFAVGDKLPSIAELMDTYDVPSLGTIRAAQQLLAEEGLLETRRGVGAFVVATESLKDLDIPAELTGLRDRLTTVIAAIESRTHRWVTIDLDDPTEPDIYFVLTTALSEAAARFRHEGSDAATDGDENRARMFERWATTTDQLLERVETA